MCHPKGYGFVAFWSGIGCGFRGNYGKVLTYLQLQFQMNKDEIEIGEFEMHLKNFSVCALIWVMMTKFLLKGQIWKRVWKTIFFFVWNRVRIWRTWRLIPAKNSQEYTPGLLAMKTDHHGDQISCLSDDLKIRWKKFTRVMTIGRPRFSCKASDSTPEDSLSVFGYCFSSVSSV